MKKLILIAIMLCLVFAWGCSKKVQTEPEVVVVEEKEVIVEEKIVEPVVDPMAVYKAEYDALPVTHTVTKGECLWWISEYKHVYNDPFMWPLIFKANRDKINNPDLIYPGQQFDVPRYGFDLEEVKASRKEAGAPWKALEPGQDAMIPAEMRAALGYSF
ncbi:MULTISPECIES: LysM peptidoglycan-binding domain-containing protein [unclassified Pseudodesulfovibrio]|jgi:nucleoid-associated protein YgaU|uniref:LysM peptidoglycan-binding domain-containing protein n=1 Tax=unclassified Pseudodesulfovibrio TaxID=2661612 RepID=UPI000FEBAD65|nr:MULTISPECIES: LysM peptidoglycan-binding domain-containing protein [unclassified Pseudodesulfovibrio]MCJ2165669.1 LysM peptidoglycan-binding domain-containing protein [Pseudodesulfovibrio sp. S3-i]RWU02934.1 peptidoglycan-binding protein [Pseudodesulfovibrio sp. S3]